MPQALRSALGCIAGFLAINVVVIGCTLAVVKAMHLRSGEPTPGSVIARPRPMMAVYVLSALLMFFGVFSYLHYKGQQPAWYQALMVVLMPLCVIGSGTWYAAGRFRGGAAGP